MIKVGILGYGNLGKGVELAIQQNDDMELVGIYTRRDPNTIQTITGAPVYAESELEDLDDSDIDVLILCGGSATDLPEQTPKYAAKFNVVDSFDTHAKVNEHFDKVDEAAAGSYKVAIISVGWDPGLFSLLRLQGGEILPHGKTYTFWGKGVSQGHSDAIRRIPGVKDARQYTNPVESALEAVRACSNPELTTREKHTRECYVVLEEGADAAKVEEAIKAMPNYFAEYDTTVHFIAEEEMQRDHSEMPHGGFVMCTGQTGKDGEHNQKIEYSLELASNPEFTASVLVAYARAAYTMYSEGGYYGCMTVFDIPPVYLSPLSPEEVRAKYL